MIANKHITKIVAVVTVIAVVLCMLAVMYSDELVESGGDKGLTMEYETKLFDTSKVLDVNIIMPEADWSEMLANATGEEYYQCDVEINGETFYRVGIRPKGNTSLSSIAMNPETDRYSFKLEFDQFVDGQNCYGLDKLVLNNNYADATNMKEALIYDMFAYVGADASLTNYASIYVNDEYWGIYLAVEAVEDSFMLRNYGAESGELYKPDSMNMGGGKPDFGGGNNKTSRSNSGNKNDGGRENNGGFGGFSFGGGGANLNYIDDSLDSYSTIWDGEVTKTNDADHQRVVTALKNISEGTSLDEYMDVDNLLKYMAVHVFSVNEDSLSGSMAHNYYLYESSGALNILPWDYNLAFGGMGMGRSNDATSVINEGVDNSFSSTNFFDGLITDEEYHAEYYEILNKLVTEYIDGGRLDEFYNRVRGQIDALVEADPNALYSYEDYLAAADTLYEVVKLRGESISGQISGTIPSTSSAQQNSAALVDASHIDLSVMGSMGSDGGFGGGGGGRGFGPGNMPGGGMPQMPSGDFIPSGEMPQMPGNIQVPDVSSGGFEMPQGNFQMPDSTSGSSFEFGNMPQGNFQMPDATSGSSFEFGNMQQGNMPEGFQGEMLGGTPSMTQSISNLDSIMLYGSCFALLLAALLIAALYKRKPRRR